MALPTTTFTVSGKTYVTELMPATEALTVLPKLVMLLGRPTTTMLLSTDKEELDAAMKDMDVVAGMLHEASVNAVKMGNGFLLFHELTRRTVCKHVQMSNGIGEAPLYDAFDGHFAGELMEMFMVAMHVARASFTKPSAAK
jgi:hypothetical protein